MSHYTQENAKWNKDTINESSRYSCGFGLLGDELFTQKKESGVYVAPRLGLPLPKKGDTLAAPMRCFVRGGKKGISTGAVERVEAREGYNVVFFVGVEGIGSTWEGYLEHFNQNPATWAQLGSDDED